MSALPLLALTGPTATGKTEMALRVAREVGGEIVSVDAFQVYRGLGIGTAQPTPEERQGVRFHLVGERDPREALTVADFRAQAEAAIAEIAARGRLPILCGGTGLYLRALLRHFRFPPAPSPESREIRRSIQSVKRFVTPAGNIRFDAQRSDAGHADEFWALALAQEAGTSASGYVPASDCDFESQPVGAGLMERVF